MFGEVLGVQVEAKKWEILRLCKERWIRGGVAGVILWTRPYLTTTTSLAAVTWRRTNQGWTALEHGYTWLGIDRSAYLGAGASQRRRHGGVCAVVQWPPGAPARPDPVHHELCVPLDKHSVACAYTHS